VRNVAESTRWNRDVLGVAEASFESPLMPKPFSARTT
jgi:hypothetical protein